MDNRTCLFCGKDIAGTHKARLYCGRSCYDKHKRRVKHEKKYCIECGKEISRNKYCSQKCMELHYKKNPRYNKKCLYCGNSFKTNDVKQEYCSPDCAYQSPKRKEVNRNTGFNTFIKAFNKKFGDRFEYVGGYINSEISFQLKCKTCGDIFTRNGQIVRRKKELTCSNCTHIASKKNKIIKKLISILRNETNKQNVIKRKELMEQFKKVSIKRTKCSECGRWFTVNHGNRKHCSVVCSHRADNRRKEHRLKKNGEPDYSITLYKLYTRDKGKCHICGKKVNMKADTNSDSYGSIDHVLPIAKGGLHQWSNVRLAHRGCNTNKRDGLTYETVGGQICLSI